MIKKLRSMWQSAFGDVDRRVRLGRILGLIFVAVGFVMIGKAWDGAASINFITGQTPYLLSGGFMGLALVITGSTLLFLSTVRAERQIMTDRFDEMITLLSRNLGRLSMSSNGSSGSQEQVIATHESYHRPDCTVLKGKEGLSTISVQQAAAEELIPCRTCDPPVVAQPAEPESKVSSN